MFLKISKINVHLIISHKTTQPTILQVWFSQLSVHDHTYTTAELFAESWVFHFICQITELMERLKFVEYNFQRIRCICPSTNFTPYSVVRMKNRYPTNPGWSPASGHEDLRGRSQFRRSPILLPARFAPWDINAGGSLQPILRRPASSTPFGGSSPSLRVPELTVLNRSVVGQSSTVDCTQSAANWEMIGTTSADGIVPLTIPRPGITRGPI